MTWTRENIGSATVAQQREMDWVYANAFFRNENDRDAFKREKTAEYLELFSRYEWAMENRPGTAGTPPTPAFAMIVTGDITGWSELAQSPTERVCETKVYKPQPKPEPGEGLIGTHIAGNWYVCLQGDITPPGKILPGTSKDNPPVTGLFEKIASPIQSSGAGQILGWFLKVG